MSSPQASFWALPEDVLLRVATAVDRPEDVLALAATCRRATALLGPDGVWRELFQRQPWRQPGWALEAAPATEEEPNWRRRYIVKAAACAGDLWHDFRATPAAMLRHSHFSSTGQRTRGIPPPCADALVLHVGAKAAAAGGHPTIASALAHVAAAAPPCAILRVGPGTVAEEAEAPAFAFDLPGTPVHIVGQTGPDGEAPTVRLCRPWVFRRSCRAALTNLKLELAGPGLGPGPEVESAADDERPSRATALLVKGAAGAGAVVVLRDCAVAGGSVVVAGHGALAAVECRFRAAGSNATGLVAKQAGEVALTRCSILDADHAGLAVQDTAYASVDQCLIAYNGGPGVKLLAASTAILTRTQVERNGAFGVLVRQPEALASAPGDDSSADATWELAEEAAPSILNGAKVLARCHIAGNVRGGAYAGDHAQLTLLHNELSQNRGPGLLAQHDATVEICGNTFRRVQAGRDRVPPSPGPAAVRSPPPRGIHRYDIVLSHAAALINVRRRQPDADVGHDAALAGDAEPQTLALDDARVCIYEA